MPDPFCADVAELADAPARGAVGRKPMRVQLPPPAPLYSRRGWNSRHDGLKPRWTSGSVPVQPRPSRPLMRPCVEQKTGRFQKPLRLTARGRASRPGRTNFIDGWWNEYTRVSETRGRKPVQVRILSRRPLWLAIARRFAPALRAAHLHTIEGSCSVSASSSSQQETRLSSGQHGCKSRRSDHFCRVVQREPSALYTESR